MVGYVLEYTHEFRTDDKNQWLEGRNYWLECAMSAPRSVELLGTYAVNTVGSLKATTSKWPQRPKRPLFTPY